MSGAEIVNPLYSLLTIFLLVASALVWGRVWRRWRTGAPLLIPRSRSLAVRVPRFALTLALGYLFVFIVSPLVKVFIASGRPATETAAYSLESVRIALYGMLSLGALVVPVFLVAIFLEARTTSQRVRLGFRSDHLGEQLKEGWLGFLASFLPVALLLLATLPLRSQEAVHPFLQMLQEIGIGQETLLIFLAAGVIAPIQEELIFRVILQNWLTEFLPTWLAIGVCAVIFAAVHGFPDAIPLLAFALILGVVYHYRRSYLTIVTIHMLFNFYNLIGTLLPRVESV